jgi:hypothetical protein
VFDLDAGPVTITLPDAGQRFMSLQVIDEDEYSPPAVYDPGPHTLTKADIGTRYILVGVRTLVDPSDPEDMAKAHALQDALKVEQVSPGVFEVPSWDPVSQAKVRESLIALSATLPDTAHAFGARGEVDPIRHFICAASTWGGNPLRDATYLNVVPPRNDGKIAYELRVKDVPVDGFWSVIVYDAKGYIPANDLGVYFLQQHHRQARLRRGGDHSLRRLRGADGQLPAHRAGLELHGAALPPAGGGAERPVEVPRGDAGGLKPSVDVVRGGPLDGRGRGRRLGCAQDPFQARQQVGAIDGLGQVVPGPEGERPVHVVRRVASGQQQDRGQGAAHGAQPGEDLEAVQPGHGHVHDDGRQARLGYSLEDLFTVADLDHAVARGFEPPGHQIEGGRVVFRDQDLGSEGKAHDDVRKFQTQPAGEV